MNRRFSEILCPALVAYPGLGKGVRRRFVCPEARAERVHRSRGEENRTFSKRIDESRLIEVRAKTRKRRLTDAKTRTRTREKEAEALLTGFHCADSG